MSHISATFVDNIITVYKKTDEDEILEQFSIPFENLKYGHLEKTGIYPEKQDYYRILLKQQITDTRYLMVYCKKQDIKIQYDHRNRVYTRMLDRNDELLSVNFENDEFVMDYFCGVYNGFGAELSDFALAVDEKNVIPFDMPIVKRKLRQCSKDNPSYIRHFRIKLDDLLYKNMPINQLIYIHVTIDGVPCRYPINKIDKELENSERKLYYLPFSTTYYKDYAIQVRRSFRGEIVLVRRRMDPIENTRFFRIMESPFMAKLCARYGEFCKRLPFHKKVNLFYEKFSGKAEEGVYEIFQRALKSNQSNNYFIIDKNSPDYPRIRFDRNVIRKYSLKYYLTIYKTDAFISTESPSHVNLLRPNNRYFRKVTLTSDFYFLQHGITYMKCHGKKSPFLAKRDSEPNYMIVGSEKERKVCADMLHIPEDRFLKTGLPIFSQIDYKHINQDSEDVAVLMLTWKPYEEHLTNFEESSYSRNTIRIAEILQERLGEDKVIIIAHPKIASLLKGKPLGERIWDKPISEALRHCKLLITDYSSVSYNAFYQGAGVVFFQQDLDLYEEENGKLIPKDDEYIGRRIFTFSDLEKCIKEGIYDNKIHLDYYRNEEFENRYHQINEFNDGKNIERICQTLKDMSVI